MTDRVPPRNIEAEMSSLGCMLLSRESLDLAAEKLGADCFYEPSHRTIFEAILDLYERGQIVDLVTVGDKLESVGKLEAVGGAVYLTKLADAVPTTAHAESYYTIVSSKSVVRSLIATATDIVRKCYDAEGEVEELLDIAETSIFDIAEKRVKLSFTPVGGITSEVVDKMEKLSEDKHYVSGVPTDFRKLDEITSGFQNSDLVVLASRPSMGKTALALNIAEYVAVDLDKKLPVAIFSLETSASQLVQRILCSRAGVDNQRVRKGFIKKGEWQEIIRAAGELTEAPIYVNDTPDLNVLQLRAIARRLKSTYDIKLVVVDYLQLLRGTGKRYENRQQEISDMSRSLKALARELDVPVLVLSQLNREVENRPNKRPQLSDLRESGAIEQDADVVLLLVRPDYYDPDDRPGMAELIVAKQRNGPVGTVELVFLKEYTRFEDSAPDRLREAEVAEEVPEEEEVVAE